MDEKLTFVDCEIILKALEVYEIKDMEEAIKHDMLQVMLLPLSLREEMSEADKELKIDESKNRMMARFKEAEKKVQQKKDSLIMLKAKIVMIRTALNQTQPGG